MIFGLSSDYIISGLPQWERAGLAANDRPAFLGLFTVGPRSSGVCSSPRPRSNRRSGEAHRSRMTGATDGHDRPSRQAPYGRRGE